MIWLILVVCCVGVVYTVMWLIYEVPKWNYKIKHQIGQLSKVIVYHELWGTVTCGIIFFPLFDDHVLVDKPHSIVAFF